VPAPLTRRVDYDSGWAEYAIADHFTLVGVPDDLPLEQAAIIPDAVSTPWGAIVGTGDVRPTQAVGVWGLGGLGAHAVQLLRLVGAAPIVAVDPRCGRGIAWFDPSCCAPTRGGRGSPRARLDVAPQPVRGDQAGVSQRGRLVLVGLAPTADHSPDA
jgi:hypothetical protein